MAAILTTTSREKRKMQKIIFTMLFAAFALTLRAAELPSVLVYTHNGLTAEGKKGYVHDNIPDCVKAIEKLGMQNGFQVVHSDDPGVFTNGALKKFKVIIFANSNNKAFDNEDERKAFQDYVRAGGGFV